MYNCGWSNSAYKFTDMFCFYSKLIKIIADTKSRLIGNEVTSMELLSGCLRFDNISRSNWIFVPVEVFVLFRCPWKMWYFFAISVVVLLVYKLCKYVVNKSSERNMYISCNLIPYLCEKLYGVVVQENGARAYFTTVLIAVLKCTYLSSIV